MERHLKPVFRSIGIHYVGRNMAAGGTSGAEEVALCSNAYFGKDVDLQSWDYGMTDGKNADKQFIYAWRIAGLSQLKPSKHDSDLDIPSRPAFMVLNYNSYSAFSFASMEMKNLTAVALFDGARQAVSTVVPDTEQITDEIIRGLPPFLQYFRCGGALENQGQCKEKKYNFTDCETRSHRASWHPGYRSQALDGTLMALGVLTALEEAMDQLAELEPAKESKKAAKTRLTKLFHQLNNEEQKRYDDFMKDPLPLHEGKWLEPMQDVVSVKDMLTLPNFCHTAKMPADQRFRGLLTEDFDKTTINPAIERTFERGFSWKEVYDSENAKAANPTSWKNPVPRHEEFIIVSTDYEKECPIDTFLDLADNFYVSSRHGWRHLTLPNDSEKKFYSEFDARKGKGWIMVCFGRCSWGKCAPDDVQPGNNKLNPQSGHLEMEINGVTVTTYETTGMGCQFLSHNDTTSNLRYNWTPNADGKYKIRARVADAETFGHIKFSSFIFF